MENNNVSLHKKLSRLQWLLQRQHIQNHSAHGPFADPTRGQGRVLALLKLKSEISTKDLSYLLGIRQQSLNELLNKMEKGGYVERRPSKEDRRVIMVHLTEKGKAEQQEDPGCAGIFDCLKEEEQTAFADYLDRIIASLEEQMDIHVSDEEMANWENAARSRMGDEMFDRMKGMHGRGHGHGPGHHHGHRFQGRESCGRSREEVQAE